MGINSFYDCLKNLVGELGLIVKFSDTFLGNYVLHIGELALLVKKYL